MRGSLLKRIVLVVALVAAALGVMPPTPEAFAQVGLVQAHAQVFKGVPTPPRSGFNTSLSPAVSYDTDALAYFAAMSTQPDATRKGLLNDFIVGLKTDGVWSKLLRMSVLSLGTSQAGLLDMVNPSLHVSAINSPTFTADRGFTGDASTQYLDIGQTYTGTGAGQNDIAFGVYINNSSARSGTVNEMGQAIGSASILMQPSNTAGSNTLVRCGSSSSSTTNTHNSTGSRAGFFSCSRSSSTTHSNYYGGAALGTAAVTSTSPLSADITLLAAGGTASSDDRVAFYFVAHGTLTDPQMQALGTRLNTLLTAIGAN